MTCVLDLIATDIESLGGLKSEVQHLIA